MARDTAARIRSSRVTRTGVADAASAPSSTLMKTATRTTSGITTGRTTCPPTYSRRLLQSGGGSQRDGLLSNAGLGDADVPRSPGPP